MVAPGLRISPGEDSWWPLDGETFDHVRGLPDAGPAVHPRASHSPLLDRVRGRRMQAAVELGVRRLELVSDLRLGPAGDLAPDSFPVRPEADRDRPDVAVLRRVEVDRVLAVTATARCCPSCEERNSFWLPVWLPGPGADPRKRPLSWWSGAGSNCRPSAFQADAHTD